MNPELRLVLLPTLSVVSDLMTSNINLDGGTSKLGLCACINWRVVAIIVELAMDPTWFVTLAHFPCDFDWDRSMC